jgi:hypothetical protein
LFLLCFLFSSHSVENNNSGIQLQLSINTAINAAIAVIFVIFTLNQSKFNSWRKPFGLLTWGGLIFGTLGIMNILLVDPMLEGGSFWPWILSLVFIYMYRKYFFPFHLKDSKFAINTAVGAGILLFFKIIVLSGIIYSIPLIGSIIGPYLSNSESHIGFYDLGTMSFLWTVGIILYYIGFSLLSSTIKEENEHYLHQFKENWKLDSAKMLAFGVRDKDLLGKSESDISDIFLDKAQELERDAFKYMRVCKLIKQRDNDDRLLDSVAGVLEYKPDDLNKTFP